MPRFTAPEAAGGVEKPGVRGASGAEPMWCTAGEPGARYRVKRAESRRLSRRAGSRFYLATRGVVIVRVVRRLRSGAGLEGRLIRRGKSVRRCEPYAKSGESPVARWCRRRLNWCRRAVIGVRRRRGHPGDRRQPVRRSTRKQGVHRRMVTVAVVGRLARTCLIRVDERKFAQPEIRSSRRR